MKPLHCQCCEAFYANTTCCPSQEKTQWNFTPEICLVTYSKYEGILNRLVYTEGTKIMKIAKVDSSVIIM